MKSAEFNPSEIFSKYIIEINHDDDFKPPPITYYTNHDLTILIEEHNKYS